MNKTLLLSLFAAMPLIAQEQESKTNQIKRPMTLNEIRKVRLADSLTQNIIDDLVNTDKNPEAFVAGEAGDSFVVVWDREGSSIDYESKTYHVRFHKDKDTMALVSDYTEHYDQTPSLSELEKAKKYVYETNIEDQSTKCKSKLIIWLCPFGGQVVRRVKLTQCITEMPVNELVKEWAAKINTKAEQERNKKN